MTDRPIENNAFVCPKCERRWHECRPMNCMHCGTMGERSPIDLTIEEVGAAIRNMRLRYNGGANLHEAQTRLSLPMAELLWKALEAAKEPKECFNCCNWEEGYCHVDGCDRPEDFWCEEWSPLADKEDC